MGMPQTFLTIGAIALLGLLILTMHSSIANSQDCTYKTNIMNESIILAQEKINEISVKSFAAVDEFNNYEKIDTLSNGEIFRTVVEINNVDPAHPDITADSETSMKRIKVTIFPNGAYNQNLFEGSTGQFSMYYYKSE